MKKRLITISKIIILVGIILIIGGIVLMCENKNEVIDEIYKVKEATEYYHNKPKLEEGQIKVEKNIKYEKDGTYKITYNTYLNDRADLKKESTLVIHEEYGTSYTLKEDSIKINGEQIKINNRKSNSEKENIKVTHNDNAVEIKIAQSIVDKKNEVEMKIKLINKKTNEKLKTSEDSYYTFTPSKANKFYEKKTTQSYVIEGTSYMILKK